MQPGPQVDCSQAGGGGSECRALKPQLAVQIVAPAFELRAARKQRTGVVPPRLDLNHRLVQPHPNPAQISFAYEPVGVPVPKKSHPRNYAPACNLTALCGRVCSKGAAVKHRAHVLHPQGQGRAEVPLPRSGTHVPLGEARAHGFRRQQGSIQRRRERPQHAAIPNREGDPDPPARSQKLPKALDASEGPAPHSRGREWDDTGGPPAKGCTGDQTPCIRKPEGVASFASVVSKRLKASNSQLPVRVQPPALKQVPPTRGGLRNQNACVPTTAHHASEAADAPRSTKVHFSKRFAHFPRLIAHSTAAVCAARHHETSRRHAPALGLEDIARVRQIVGGGRSHTVGRAPGGLPPRLAHGNNVEKKRLRRSGRCPQTQVNQGSVCRGLRQPYPHCVARAQDAASTPALHRASAWGAHQQHTHSVRRDRDFPHARPTASDVHAQRHRTVGQRRVPLTQLPVAVVAPAPHLVERRSRA
eukprot:3939860-Rhodomonas_salina.2